jgi:hypothetical protein
LCVVCILCRFCVDVCTCSKQQPYLCSRRVVIPFLRNFTWTIRYSTRYTIFIAFLWCQLYIKNAFRNFKTSDIIMWENFDLYLPVEVKLHENKKKKFYSRNVWFQKGKIWDAFFMNWPEGNEIALNTGWEFCTFLMEATKMS